MIADFVTEIISQFFTSEVIKTRSGRILSFLITVLFFLVVIVGIILFNIKR